MAEKHVEIAERFRFFMEAGNLDNSSFLEGVDNAITASSLFSILNGNRKPSKILAVLIERTWGFRADFLLEGQGEMWSKPARKRGSRYSEEEKRVIAFMRASVANARDLQITMEKSEIWSKLYARTEKELAVLETCALSEVTPKGYPRLCRETLKECMWIAEAFETLTLLFHQRRICRLIIRFLDRYLCQLPEKKPDFSALQTITAPVLDKKKQELELLERSIVNQKQTLENLCDLNLPHERLSHLEEGPEHKLKALADDLIKRDQNQAAALIQSLLEERKQQTSTTPEAIAAELAEMVNWSLDPVRARSLPELEAIFSITDRQIK